VPPEAELPPVLRLTDANADLKEMPEADTTAEDSHAVLGRRRPLLSQAAILEEDELDEETAMGLRSALTLSPTEAQQHAIDANPAENRLAVRVSLRVRCERAGRVRSGARCFERLVSLVSRKRPETVNTQTRPPFLSLTHTTLLDC
jgi:hypothetical protein